MDMKAKVIEWCRRMGYDGDVPSLENVCSHSTSFLWQELMQNTRPKQEVSVIRNNLIIRRLKEKPLEKQDEYAFSLQEIEAFQKRRELEMKKTILQEIITDKRIKANHLARDSRMKCISKELLNAQVKENMEKEFLLNLKARQLQKQITESEEMLTTAKNVTPIELDEAPNKDEITDTLHRCAEKLWILVQKIAPTQSNLNHERSSISQLSSFKTPGKFECKTEYCTLSKRKNHNEIPLISVSESKPNKISNCQRTALKHHNNKNLFEEHTTKVTKIAEEECIIVQTDVPKRKNRESLGILHDSCLLNMNEDSFLMDMECDLSPVKQEKLEQNQWSIPETENLNNSTLSSLVSVRTAYSERDRVRKPETEYDKIFENEYVTDLLRQLIYSHNRQAVWNVFQILNDNLSIDITNRIIGSSKIPSKEENFEHDIAKLHLIHIQNELKIIKQNAILKVLSSKISSRKMDTFSKLKSQGIGEETYNEIKDSFELKLKDVRYDACLAELKKQIQLAKKVADNTELQVVLGKCVKVKEEIVSKTLMIQHYIEQIDQLNYKTLRTRETAKVTVQRLQPFIFDMTWSEALTEKRFSQEIKVFEKYPLEYNRVCQNTNPKVYYRDLCTNNFPVYKRLDFDCLYMLSEILKNPYSPPEVILQNFMQLKTKLRSLTNCSDSFQDELNELKSKLRDIRSDENYSTDHLKSHNDYIGRIIEKLNAIIFSTSANKILSVTDTIKEAIEIWEEMPLKHHIPSNRFVNGMPYKYYENKFNSLLENLEYGKQS